MSDTPLNAFFDQWVKRTGAPQLSLVRANIINHEAGTNKLNTSQVLLSFSS